MQINITLFIQIINFFLTYKILDKFFLKPMLQSLRNKKTAKCNFESKIKHDEKTVEDLKESKKTQLASFQTYIKKQYPFISPKYLLIEQQLEITKKENSPKNLNVLKNKIKLWIIKKVPNAY